MILRNRNQRQHTQHTHGQELKIKVRDFWDAQSCGERYARAAEKRDQLQAQSKIRYQLEPYIPEFARFCDGAGRAVLEIGVGMGADHLRWAEAGPRTLAGIDLTPGAIEHTAYRFQAEGYTSDLRVSDAEAMPFGDESFDIVYSWGVIHHSPDTLAAVREIHRVLKIGGVARVAIYHKYSIVGAMLWARYGLFAGRPCRSLDEIYSQHLESPGTKAYTYTEAKDMFSMFRRSDVVVQLCFGDLLEGEVGQRHTGLLLSLARKVWPRALIRRLLKSYGLYLLIEAVK